MKKRIFFLISIEILIVLLLTIAWEFWLEDIAYSFLAFDHEPESVVEKFEYVVTSFVFVLIALIFPIWVIFKGVSKLEQNRAKLEAALDNIKTLKGLIPVCANCKMIRNSDGDWQQLEVYIRDHSDAVISHGICSVCAGKLYPGL